MSDIARLERDVEMLNKRVSRLENEAQIKRMLEVEQTPEVKGLLAVLKRMPQMAPYIVDDET